MTYSLGLGSNFTTIAGYNTSVGGHYYLPSTGNYRILIQWGQVAGASSNISTDVSFATAYSSGSVPYVFITNMTNVGGGGNGSGPSIMGIDTAGFKVDSQLGATNKPPCLYLAIGKI